MNPSARARSDLDRFRWVLTLAALLLLTAGIVQVLAPFFKPLCWAIILVLSTWRPYRRLLQRVKGRTLAAALMTAAAAAVIILLFGPILAALIAEAQASSERYHQWYLIHRARLPDLAMQIPLIGARLAGYLRERQLADQLVSFLGDYQNEIFGLVSSFARGILGAVFQLLVCLFCAFFVYRDGHLLGAQLRDGLLRIGGERFGLLLDSVSDTVRGSVYGAIVTALAQGLFATLGYIAAGAPAPLLLGIATTVLSPIPFGAPLVYVPTSIVVGLQHSWWFGLALLLWGALGVSSIDNFVRPYFISQSTRMPIVLVFFGIVGGAFAFGVLGVFLGPVLLAVAQQLWFEWIAVDTLASERR